MKRDLNKLANQHFDVLIVGGGIHGAAIAREAAISGLKTALIEQNDFSQATSANSLKILHGGFRYLKDFDLKRMRASKKSQIEFNRIAPHLVSPLGCTIPTYGYGLRGKHLMRIALLINNLMGFENCQKFGKGKLLSKQDLAKIINGPIDSKINGAAVWYDAIVQDTERLTIAILMNAVKSGACIANYVKATKLLLKNSTAIGVLAEDRYGKAEFEIRSRKVVNATGPWVENLLNTLPKRQKKEFRLVRGLNIIVRNCLFESYAVGLEGGKDGHDSENFSTSKKRFFFFVPWNDRTMIGTSYKLYHGHPDQFRVGRSDIEEFLRDINQLYPPAGLEFKDVVFFHAGLLPLTNRNIKTGSDAEPSKRETLIDHEKRDGIRGLLSVRSIKYTTAPFMAKKVIKKLGFFKKKKNKIKLTKSQSAGLIQRGANVTDKPILDEYLSLKYSSYGDKIVSLVVDDPALASWISKEPPLIAAEIIYAIREEMALRLSDIVFRRTGFGTAGCPSIKKLETLADIAARELGWSSKQKSDELADVLRCYNPLLASETSHAGAHIDNYAGITS